MSARAWKQKKPTPLDRGPPLHVNSPLICTRKHQTENSPYLATLPQVSPPSDVWETSTEIPYWWRVTTQIWVVIVPRGKFDSTHQKQYPDLGSDASSVWLFESNFPRGTTNQKHSLYKGLIEPHFDYCNAVWYGLIQQLSEKLQKLQNCSIRVITKSSHDTSSRFLLNSLGWDNLSVRRAKQKAHLMYKCVKHLALAYLCNLFCPKNTELLFSQREEKINAPKTKNWLPEA